MANMKHEIDANELLSKMTIEVKTNKLFGFRLLVLELLLHVIRRICRIEHVVEYDFDKEN